jgi:spore coat polysaccharide biosynthesis predicted glycosyltransferase SpsG
LAGELQSLAARRCAIRFWIEGDQAAVEAAVSAGFDARLVDGTEPDTTLALARACAASTVIVDAYHIREEALTSWRAAVGHLVVIDDLADRFLDADVVVNATPQAPRLRHRTSTGCRLLLGPRYALLRAQFRDCPVRPMGTVVRTVLVTLGGSDPAGSTTTAVVAAMRALPTAELDVVVGPLFGGAQDVKSIADRFAGRVRLHGGLDDLAPLMASADLAVSGGGQTLFELAAVGLPAVAVCLAPNQEPNIAALENVTLLDGGKPPDGAVDAWPTLEEACLRLTGDPKLRADLSRAGQSLVDGWGARRVAEVILGM